VEELKIEIIYFYKKRIKKYFFVRFIQNYKRVFGTFGIIIFHVPAFILQVT